VNIIAILGALLVLGVLGLLFGGVLGVADKKFAVETDPRVEKVRSCLAGANCGACGYAGCDAFAQAVVSGEAKPNGCTPGGETTAKAIGEVMGIQVATQAPTTARVICQGTCDHANVRYQYDGYQSCSIAASLAGGPKQCAYACIGLGDCVKACPFDAIQIKNGIASIDEKKCRSCGACVAVCPRNVIKIKPMEATVMVRCQNQDSGRAARSACTKACIACQRCVKECPVNAISVQNNFAVINDEVCIKCGACAKVCPCGCITVEETHA